MMQKINKWLEENFASKNTQRVYRSALTDFFNHAGNIQTSEELKHALTLYIQTNKHRAPKTLNTYVAAVISYFADQGIRIDEASWKRIKKRLLPPTEPLTVDKAGTHEEWKRILSHMDIKGRSLFLFLLSSGARIGETLELKITDLELDADPPRAHIRPTYAKGGSGGRTVFMSYEARDAIREWLNVKGVIHKRGPKAIGDWDINYVWDINESTTRLILYNALEKAKLNEIDNITQRYKIHIHSTRKFFDSNCGLDKSLKEALMGHSGYLDRSYFLKLRENPDEVGKEYKSIAMPKLTIFERPTTDKVELIKAFARSLGVSNIDIKIARLLEEAPELTEEEAIGRLIRAELGTELNNNKEYKTVTDDELVDYLNRGWVIVQPLNSNKIVVARAKHA